MENNLSLALSNSISSETGSLASNVFEAGLDVVMDDGFLKEIPIVSTAISLYKIGHTIHERHYLKKLAAFIAALNRGAAKDEQREYYKSKITDDPDSRNKELEYVLVVIERYTNSDKAQMLAKLYLAYLNERISWQDFTKYSEVLDRLMPGDYTELCNGIWSDINDADVSDSLLRLVSLGLVVSHNKGVKTGDSPGSLVFPDAAVKDYEITKFGSIFLDCLS